MYDRRVRRNSRRFRIRLVSPGMRTVEQTRQIDLLSDGSLFDVSVVPSHHGQVCNLTV